MLGDPGVPRSTGKRKQKQGFLGNTERCRCSRRQVAAALYLIEPRWQHQPALPLATAIRPLRISLVTRVDTPLTPAARLLVAQLRRHARLALAPPTFAAGRRATER